MKISELPEEIRIKALEYQKKAASESNNNYSEHTNFLNLAFNWHETKEGNKYWVDLHNAKPEKSKEYDFVNPDHYKQGGKGTIDMMVDIWGRESVATHCEITAYKYMQRLGKKPDNPISQDLDKALWYLNKAKELRLNESK